MTHRIPALDANWPVAGLATGNVAAVLAAWLLLPLFSSSLPAAPAGSAIYWPCFATFSLAYPAFALAVRRERPWVALEVALPISLFMAGLSVSGVAATVLVNLDAPRFVPFVESPTALVVFTCGGITSFALARWLGSAALIRRLRREAHLNRRSAWLAEVRSDRSGRLVTAVVAGVPVVPCVALVAVIPPSPPALIVWMLALWFLAAVPQQSAWVSINDAGIRVSGLLVWGWSLPLSQLASARAVEAGLGAMIAPDVMHRRCILRLGPALEVTSPSGGRYLVSLPQAEEAVSTLKQLVERR